MSALERPPCRTRAVPPSLRRPASVAGMFAAAASWSRPRRHRGLPGPRGVAGAAATTGSSVSSARRGGRRRRPSPTGAHPNPYGILQFIYGTAVTSLIAMLLAVPVAVAVALYITESPRRGCAARCRTWSTCSRRSQSVVYGFWGIFALHARDFTRSATASGRRLGGIPVIGAVFAGPFFGVSYFDRRRRAGDHGAADRHRDLPRGLRRRPGRGEGGGARARGDPLGDAAHVGPAALAVGHLRRQPSSASAARSARRSR